MFFLLFLCVRSRPFTVINPTMKFNWLEKHWDEEELASARCFMKKSVSALTVGKYHVKVENWFVKDARIPARDAKPITTSQFACSSSSASFTGGTLSAEWPHKAPSIEDAIFPAYTKLCGTTAGIGQLSSSTTYRRQATCSRRSIAAGS